MQVCRIRLYVPQNLHPAACHIDPVPPQHFLHCRVELLRIPVRLIELMRKLVFKIFLTLLKRFLMGDFFERPYVSAHCKEGHIRQEMKLPVKIQGEAELICKADLFIRRFQTILRAEDVQHFLKIENITIDNDASLLPLVPFLFFHFIQKQGIEILLLQIIQREDLLILEPNISLRQMFHHDPGF